jgi:hypothetical protein
MLTYSSMPATQMPTQSTVQSNAAAASPQRRRRRSVREITPVYWRRLIETGMPLQTANVVAWAIARYDVGRKLPEPMECKLIKRYSRFICRAGLWRSQLLLQSKTLYSLT